MHVMKFGAIAFTDVDRTRETVRIIRDVHRDKKSIVVVCSALPGITDALLRAARAAAHGSEQYTDVARRELWNRHRSIAEKLVTDDWEREMLFQRLSEQLKHLDRMTRAMATLGEYSARGIDAIASLGERFAAHVIAVVLRQHGVAAQMIDATELIVTDDRFGAARPYYEDSTIRIQERLIPMLQAGIIPVITGYTGATRAGVVTTLGRGGGDYTAALIGASINADEVCLWTDVDGVLTADPKIVPQAVPLPELSYAEAAEMATLSGSEILHLRTLMPLAANGIPLRIANVLSPSLPGTVVLTNPRPSHQNGAIISTRGLSLVAASASALPAVHDAWTPEHAASVITQLSHAGIETLLAHQSELDRTLMVLVRHPDTSYTEEIFASAFSDGYQQSIMNSVALISVISAPHGGALTPRAMLALGNAQIHIIATSRAIFGNYVSFVLPDDEVESAVRVLHDSLGFSGSVHGQITSQTIG
ncbi:MAG: aspartate kinase [Roseiflexaceae bacterium]